MTSRPGRHHVLIVAEEPPVGRSSCGFLRILRRPLRLFSLDHYKGSDWCEPLTDYVSCRRGLCPNAIALVLTLVSALTGCGSTVHSDFTTSANGGAGAAAMSGVAGGAGAGTAGTAGAFVPGPALTIREEFGNYCAAACRRNLTCSSGPMTSQCKADCEGSFQQYGSKFRQGYWGAVGRCVAATPCTSTDDLCASSVIAQIEPGFESSPKFSRCKSDLLTCAREPAVLCALVQGVTDSLQQSFAACLAQAADCAARLNCVTGLGIF